MQGQQICILFAFVLIVKQIDIALQIQAGIIFMLCYYVIYLTACALTQTYSLLHPSKKVFRIAAPHLGILQCCLDSILTATEG